MNRLIIYEYINRLKKIDIINFCNSKGIMVNDHDLDIVYSYIKNDYKRFFNNPMGVLEEINGKVSDYTFNVIMKLYDKYKGMIK